MRSPPRIAVTVLVVAIIAALATSARAEQGCVLRSDQVDLGEVTITSGGVPRFSVITRGIGVTATITASGETRVKVRGSIVFSGVARHPHLRFLRPELLQRPPLRLARATTLIRPRLASSGAVLFDVPLARQVWAQGITGACRDLELAPAPAETLESAPLPDGPVQYPATLDLLVSEDPGEGAQVLVRMLNPTSLPLTVTAGRGDQVAVEAYLPGGTIRGFVPTSSLAAIPELVGVGMAGSRGACGCLGPSRRWARVAKGTGVSARPGGVRWASFPEEAYAVVGTACTDGQAPLYQLPDVVGVGSHDLIEHAWVPAKALSLPRGGAWHCEKAREIDSDFRSLHEHRGDGGTGSSALDGEPLCHPARAPSTPPGVSPCYTRTPRWSRTGSS